MGRVFIKGSIYVEYSGDQIHTRELLAIVKKPVRHYLVYNDEIFEGFLPNNATIEFLDLNSWSIGKKAQVVFDQYVRFGLIGSPKITFLARENGDYYGPDDLLEPEWYFEHISPNLLEKVGFDKIRPISDDFKLKPDQVLTYPDRFLENRSNVIELVISDKRTVYIYETENKSVLGFIFPILKEEGLDLCQIDFIDLSSMSKVYILNKGQKYQVFAKGFVPNSQYSITSAELGRFVAAVKGCSVENVLIFCRDIFDTHAVFSGGKKYYYEILQNCKVEECRRIRPTADWKLAKEHQIVNGYLEKKQKQIFTIGTNQIDLYDREDILKTDLFEREFPDKKPTKWWFEGFVFYANVVPKSLAYSLKSIAESLKTPQEHLVLHRDSIFDQFPRSAELVPGTAFEYTILPEGFCVKANGDIFYTPKKSQKSADISQILGETCHFYADSNLLTTNLVPNVAYKVDQMVNVMLGKDMGRFHLKENVIKSPFYSSKFPDATPNFTLFSRYSSGYVLVTDVVPVGGWPSMDSYRYHLANATGNSKDSVIVYEPGSVFNFNFMPKAGTRLNWTVLRKGYRFDGNDIFYKGPKNFQEIQQDFADSVDFEKATDREEIRIFLKQDKLSFQVTDIKRNITWTFTSDINDKPTYQEAKEHVRFRLEIQGKFIFAPKDRVFRDYVRTGDSFEILMIQ